MSYVMLDERELERLVERIADAVVRKLAGQISPPGRHSGSVIDRIAAERMTYAEVAAAIGVKKNTVQKWVSQGSHGFPEKVSVGGAVYFIRSEIDAWLQKRQRKRSKTDPRGTRTSPGT